MGFAVGPVEIPNCRFGGQFASVGADSGGAKIVKYRSVQFQTPGLGGVRRVEYSARAYRREEVK